MIRIPEVKVYSTPTCPYCMKAKDFFREHNVAFEEIDVSKDHSAMHQLVERTGQMGVPVIEIDGNLIVGFDKERIMSALGIKG